MSEDLIPVNLSERGGHVSVLLLLELPDGTMALHEDDQWHKLGQVREVEMWGADPTTGRRRMVKLWLWHYDEDGYGAAEGEAKSKKAAIAGLLEYGGYRVVPDTASIPGLF